MENRRKRFAVLGLGSFGASLAISLQRAGCDVVVVDAHMEDVEAISDTVTYAMQGSIENEDLIRSLEVQNLDGVVVASTESMEASIMATLQAKEQGCPYVLAKAINQLHADVLKKVGADEVIRSEEEMGKRVANHLVTSDFKDWISGSSACDFAEKPIPKSWVGKTLKEMDVRNQFGVTVAAIEDGERTELNPNPNKPLKKDVTLVLLGDMAKLDQIL